MELRPIASLDSALLADRDYLDCLSGVERQQFAGIRNARRGNEWLAGRLSVKFLFLSGADAPSGLIRLTADDLRAFSPSKYRQVEVSRRDDVRSGRPQICWLSEAGSKAVDAAITHTNGIACAFLGSGETAAIDMECVEPRSRVFYDGNFTQHEKAWVEDSSRSLKLDPRWTFTLLWSVKECLLKTPVFSSLSIWDMPSLEVGIISGSEGLVSPHAAKELNGAFTFLNTEVTDRYRRVYPDVAVTGRHDLVLTVISGVNERIA